MESRDHDLSGDYNENSDSGVIDGRFAKINTMMVDDIMNLILLVKKKLMPFIKSMQDATVSLLRKIKCPIMLRDRL
jgi:hypothetical protein